MDDPKNLQQTAFNNFFISNLVNRANSAEFLNKYHEMIVLWECTSLSRSTKVYFNSFYKFYWNVKVSPTTSINAFGITSTSVNFVRSIKTIALRFDMIRNVANCKVAADRKKITTMCKINQRVFNNLIRSSRFQDGFTWFRTY